MHTDIPKTCRDRCGRYLGGPVSMGSGPDTSQKLPLSASTRSSSGFTLIELMIVVAIIGIIAAIAYPSYIDSVVKTKRAAAAACLSEYANFMERYYTTNLTYAGASLPNLDCASAGQTGDDYTYGFDSATDGDDGVVDTVSTYQLEAVPSDPQASRDDCGTLTLDQAGTRGAADDVDVCW